LQDSLSQSLPIYFHAFDLLNRNGDLLVNLPFSSRRELLEDPLAVPEDPLRLSPVLRAQSGQVLEAVRKLGLEGIVGKRLGSITNPVSDQALGSSSARTWSRSSHRRLHSRCAWVRRAACWAFDVERGSMCGMPGKHFYVSPFIKPV
jgi:hypothetical protein